MDTKVDDDVFFSKKGTCLKINSIIVTQSLNSLSSCITWYHENPKTYKAFMEVKLKRNESVSDELVVKLEACHLNE